MDIRTLLTEVKPFLPKRKADAISSNWTVMSETSSHFTGNSSSDQSAACASPLNGAPSVNVAKRVKFNLHRNVTASGPRSFFLNVSATDPPHAITATVKDFFALHNCGVSFSDVSGSILVITADNLTDEMEVIVNQTGVVEPESRCKKRRKSMLSSRKRTKKPGTEKESTEDEYEEEEQGEETEKAEPNEKREKIFSSEVSIDNIIHSSRRRLSKFSSDNLPLMPSFLKSASSNNTRAPRKPLHMGMASPREHLLGQTSLPTPTPTSASVISDEDVAIQLIRLTDPLATPILSPCVLDSEPETQSSRVDSFQASQEENPHGRCTRCISSKKGCDRKRPCGRCLQQGFDDSSCHSDDEKGSARKKVAAMRRSTMMGKTVGRSRRVNGRS